MQNIQWTSNRFKNTPNPVGSLGDYSIEKMMDANEFHFSMPEYRPTPLHVLSGLAEDLGASNIYVKDESKRFGLNAFKALGATYAMACWFAGELEIDLNEVTFNELLNQVADRPEVTFATATDGNHGKGVAWAADIFGQQGKVYLPKGAARSRLEAVLAFGAEGYITDQNYDDTVENTAKLAMENGWVLLQDTAWKGYEEIPMNIMQGYTTIVAEIIEQLEREALEGITHVILQAGVGSFAASIAAALYNVTSGNPPKIIIVEPSRADCLYQSALSSSGNPERVPGDLDTMMAGLACGEPNPAAWKILKSVSDYFISCDDTVSAKGMHILGNPASRDEKVVSGASGAVPAGFLYEVMTSRQYEALRTELKIDQSSDVLIINTEGDTDPENYRSVVWDGKNGYGRCI